MEFLIFKYENGTISLIIQETLPWETIFNSVTWRIECIILKSEGHSENQILYLCWLCYPREIKMIIIIIIIIITVIPLRCEN